MTYRWATYQAARGCTRYGPAGAQALLVYLEDRFPNQKSFGICNCRTVAGGGSWSHHAECRAYDEGFAVFMGQRIGIETLELLGPHGAELGIDHLIMNTLPGSSGRGDPRIYSARSPQGRVYTGSHPHKNHNHIGLTRNAGRYLTYAKLVLVLGPAIPNTGDDEMLLKRNSGGQMVAELQKMMAEEYGQNNGKWAPFPGKSPFDGQAYSAGEDGDFGGTAEVNVKNVQGMLGQAKTGVVDQLLWDAMVDDRYSAAAVGGDHPDADHANLVSKKDLDHAILVVQASLRDHTTRVTSGPHR